MFSSKQTHKFNYFICYHLESGWHVTRPSRVFLSGEERAWERGWNKWLLFLCKNLHANKAGMFHNFSTEAKLLFLKNLFLKSPGKYN